MQSFADVQYFVQGLNRASDFKELESIIDDAARASGFHYFALVHHVDFSLPQSTAVGLSNYPDSWIEVFLERQYYVDDPIHAASQKVASAFLWSDVASLINMSSRQKQILNQAKVEGLGDGFTIPIHVPGEYFGSCSFGTKYGRPYSQECLPNLNYFGCFAFEAARRIMRTRSADTALWEKIRLTNRQLDCVALVGQGKSNWEASRILGISENTVHQHIEDAKKRYDVTSRTQLVVRALFDQQLTFKDIVRPGAGRIVPYTHPAHPNNTPPKPGPTSASIP